VRVEVQQPELPVDLGVRAQLGQRARVVAADADRGHPGLGDRPDEVLDARQRVLDVAGHGRRVAEVDGGQLAEDLHAQDRVEGAQHARGAPDRLGAHAGAGAERRAAVVGHAEDGRVRAFERVHVGQPRERARAGVARRLERVPGLVHRRRS
jgi:hypothetical protein